MSPSNTYVWNPNELESCGLMQGKFKWQIPSCWLQLLCINSYGFKFSRFWCNSSQGECRLAMYKRYIFDLCGNLMGDHNLMKNDFLWCFIVYNGSSNFPSLPLPPSPYLCLPLPVEIGLDCLCDPGLVINFVLFFNNLHRLFTVHLLRRSFETILWMYEKSFCVGKLMEARQSGLAQRPVIKKTWWLHQAHR